MSGLGAGAGGDAELGSGAEHKEDGPEQEGGASDGGRRSPCFCGDRSSQRRCTPGPASGHAINIAQIQGML